MYPTLLHFGHFYLPTFGLLAALGLVAAASLSLRTARLAGMSADGVWDAGLFAVLAAFAASRVLLVAFNFRSFLAAPILLLMVPSLTAAGLGLAAAAVAVYLRWKGLPLLGVLDAWAAPATLVWAFLAMGHLAEGSDPGMPSRWGLRTSLAGYREQPVALYAAVLATLVAVWLYGLVRRRWPAGSVGGVGLVTVGVVQFGLTFLRMPYVYAPGSGMLEMLDPLEWVGLGMVVAGAVVMGSWQGREGISPLRPSAFGRDDGSVEMASREDGALSHPGSRNTGVSPLALLGRDDGGERVLGRDGGERALGRDDGGERALGRDDGGERVLGRDGGERALGRDDGGERLLGRDDGGRERSGTVHREHSMRAHQVVEQQGRRGETRGRTNERES